MAFFIIRFSADDSIRTPPDLAVTFSVPVYRVFESLNGAFTVDALAATVINIIDWYDKALGQASR